MKKSSELLVSADVLCTEHGPVSQSALRIKDGLIDRIENIDTGDRHTRCLHFAGCTIRPCFCDYHLHFFARTSTEERKAVEALISHGVTSSWDGGGPDGYGLAVREETKRRMTLRSPG